MLNVNVIALFQCTILLLLLELEKCRQCHASRRLQEEDVEVGKEGEEKGK